MTEEPLIQRSLTFINFFIIIIETSENFPSIILVGNMFSESDPPYVLNGHIEKYTKLFNVFNHFECTLEDSRYVEKQIFTAVIHKIIQRNMPDLKDIIEMVDGIDKFGPIHERTLCPNCKRLTSSGEPFCNFCNFRTDHRL